MKKFAVWASLGASVHVGDYEAESADQAIQMAHDDPQANWMPSICHQCSNEVDIGEAGEAYAEETE